MNSMMTAKTPAGDRTRPDVVASYPSSVCSIPGSVVVFAYRTPYAQKMMTQTGPEVAIFQRAKIDERVRDSRFAND